MKSEILYHGSIFGGLDKILANAKSHSDGGKVAYFTTDRVYALVCCRSKEEKPWYGKEKVFESEQKFIDGYKEDGYEVIDVTDSVIIGETPDFVLSRMDKQIPGFRE